MSIPVQVLGTIWLKIKFVFGGYLNMQPKRIATLDFPHTAQPYANTWYKISFNPAACDILFDIKLRSRQSLTIFYLN